MGSVYTVVGPGGVVAVAVAVAVVVVVAADEVVVDGEVDGAEPVIDGVEGVVVTHRNVARVGVSGHTQGQAGDSVSLPVSGPAEGLSHPGLGDFE